MDECRWYSGDSGAAGCGALRRGFFTLAALILSARAYIDRVKGREYAESSLTNATGKRPQSAAFSTRIVLAGDVYEVEWIDDPGVFHRADYQAVRAPGSSPARGAARPPTHAPASPVWAPDARAAPAASYAMLGFGQPAAAPEQAAPATGSGRAAAQEAARRIREQS